ncbi:MAG: response regulator transcription factor [Alphaproteobacteria bacterium]
MNTITLMTPETAVRKFKARILIVDDEPLTLDLIRLTLTTDGFHVVAAPSGKDALRLIAEQSFDLLVLDMMMPELTGFDVLRRLRSTKTNSPPVIMLSAVDTSDAKQTSEELGAIGYLRKPISRGSLLDAVSAALDTSTDEDTPN